MKRSRFSEQKINHYPLIFLILCSFALNQSSKAQEHKFGIKTSPISPIYGPVKSALIPLTGELRLSSEFRIHSNLYLSGGASYLYDNPLSDWENNGLFTSLTFKMDEGYGYHGVVKFFPLKGVLKGQPPEGFYLGPFFSYSYVHAKGLLKETRYYAHGTRKHIDIYPYQFSVTKLDYGFLSTGYQFLYSSGFALDLFLRFKYQLYKVDIYSWGGDWRLKDFFEINNSGLRPSIGVEVGYFFGSSGKSSESDQPIEE